MASVYDRLASLVFGKQWRKIQMAPAFRVQDKQEILVVGGGSGKVLEGLHQDQRVTYVELSGRMIERAKGRISVAQIDFIAGDYLTWDNALKFDVILFPFFLDVFSESNLQLILAKARKELGPHGELHVIDFKKGGAFRNSLVKLMYIFFRSIASLEGKKLLDLDHKIANAGFERIHYQEFFNDWIFYSTYRKTN